MSSIRDNVESCLARLRMAAERSRRPFKDVTLVVVTKGVGLSLVCEALDCGLVHIGESRIQEVATKYEALNQYAARKKIRIIWHMIGHLQTNKVKDAVKLFDLIHSVDSFRLAQCIDIEAKKAGKIQEVLVQVNVSGEPSKSGFSPGVLIDELARMKNFSHIKISGLMTIAPLTEDLSVSRSCFRRLKELRDDVNRQGSFALTHLSMGMTHDFEVAVEEGASFVRVGTAIFGERNK
ncbi:MAG: YggS family pyridoxal phosphate-dependent enzyme [Candidatus Omnitrophota bacterium]